MTSLSEQLSAVRKSQFEAQLDLMSALTTQAFQSAQQVMALNFNTSRASVERSANAFKQLLSVSDPRDLFALGSHTQEQVQQMLSYGRELFSIASGARANLQRQIQAQPAVQPQQHAAAPAQEAIVPAAVEEGIDPPAEPTPIAKAVRKVAAKHAAVPHPLASEIAIAPSEVELPKVEPLEASPPPPAPPGKPALEVKQAPLPGIKAPRKNARK
ncbi:MAG TPA: phasin family protein [Telluria sp.]|nr:phasin family protein [Telluria sp.]